MNPCATYDFRYSESIGLQTFKSSDIISFLKGVAKKFTFQLEQGDTGYRHFQGRMSLIKKRRKHEALPLFKVAPNYFEPTVVSEHVAGDAFYAQKEDTRIEGPWTDKDQQLYIPRQVKEMEGLRPFQLSIVEDENVWDTRHINVVYCIDGNIGKSRLVQYCRAYQIGRPLPPVNDFKDLLRMVCDLPTSKLYLFDMPRSLGKEKMFQFFSAVETIKDGYAYDDRYSFREKVFDCPNIWIFTNVMPDTDMLSADRWRIWTVDKDTYQLNKLEKVDWKENII